MTGPDGVAGTDGVPTEGPVEAPTASGDGAATGEPRAEGFGDSRVDAAMARLDTVGGLPGSEQVAEYEAVHRVLQDTLATIDEAPEVASRQPRQGDGAPGPA